MNNAVGSLVRPPKLISFLEEIEFDACLRESIAEVVRQQGFRVRPGNFTNACTGPIRYIGHAQVQRDIP